uniref:glycosyltransferase n=1 Tax=Helicobacter acinonychis TaxID=212 RepID=UPI002D78010B
MDGLSAENIEKLKETLVPFSAFSGVEFLEISTHNAPKENQEIKKNQTIESDHYQSIDPIIANKIEELFTKLSAFSQKRFSKMIMCRLLLASLFPQYDKMIMFDVDTLFVGDISESFFIPLDEHYFGMVKEWKCEAYVEFPSFVKCRKHDAELGLCDADKLVSLEEAKIIHSYFFNCGFMSINLALWRKDNLEKCFYEFILLGGAGLCCPEQD